MKRAYYIIFFATLLLVSMGGCKKTEETKQAKGKEMVAAEYNRGYASEPGSQIVMATESGYYFYDGINWSDGEGGGFYYVDKTTGNKIYLCNKPECRHDGNMFCIATNEKYQIGQTVLYGTDRIYATAIEETETQYLYKLLCIELDGSELNEVVTFMTMEKTAEGCYAYCNGLLIHQNVVFLTFSANAVGSEMMYGTAMYFPDTGEVRYVDEEPLAENNVKSTNLNAYGDHIYYCRREGKKNVLYRYNIKTGETENCKLLSNFSNRYAVWDEDTIVYLRSSGKSLCVCHPSTGENVELPDFVSKKTALRPDGTSYEIDGGYEGVGIKTDGEYLYVWEKPTFVKIEPELDVKTFQIHVFDKDLKEVAAVDLGESFASYQVTEGRQLWLYNLGDDAYFLGEEILFPCYVSGTVGDYVVFRCKREDLFLGKSELKRLFKMETEY